ncbi:CsgG/HfaB family protein [Flavobacterium sp. FlaQc-57]|uniref:CsgG/HfaB family protein n=1 Tax=Flavobacterium sp. FlaQc-57 TaxID=3374186 RepID=UPI0037579268
MRVYNYLILLLVLLFSGCGAFYNQPTGVEKAVLGESTPATSLLKELPKPKEQIVVGVYKFRDQTGQYKPQENGSNFSTAVTQGATSILLKALEDSKWFIPIERENIGNLLQERNLIRSTRQEYSKNANPNEPQLTPLLYAGVLLEGGIISYDSNIITGGFGARYFGTGGSIKYRQDRVTIYLRMVSTSNGKILKSVYISKTILSQAIDESLFKYVSFKRLLEVETGYTTNEPVHMAVTEAIEKAVQSLVLEGIQDNIWQADATPSDLAIAMKRYETENEVADRTALYGRDLEPRRSKFAIEISGGTSLIDGDYANPVLKPMGRGALKYFITHGLNISASTNAVILANKDIIDVGYLTYDLNLELLLLPKDKFSPYVYGGGGFGMNKKSENTHSKIQFGAGVEYLVSNSVGIKLFGEYDINFSDNIDYLVAGVRDDYYYKFGLGLTYYFSSNKNKSKK